MILTAHQPCYLPWLGLFHKIAISDLFCYFDIVQYQKKDFNNRNKIKTINGEIWLSVPVESKNHLSKNVSQIPIIKNNWVNKHIKSIEINYRKAAYFENYFEDISRLLNVNSNDNLGKLNLSLLKYFLNVLSIETPIVLASDYNFIGEKSNLVLDMCKKLKATKYIFGANGLNYADTRSFKKNNIKIHFQDYRHPTYRQLNGCFLPYMSVIDLLFNEGQNSKNIILKNNIKKNQI
jgi:hypothetical protein